MLNFGKGHHLHLIDGSAFIFRAYHALPPLTRKSDGAPIGAVSGFCNMLYRYLADNHGSDSATHLAVIFDHSGKSFRNTIYPAYKANRPPAPEDLIPQFPLVREATHAYNIACHELENYEADDIIATLARQASHAGGRCTIISSDKDLMQLVGAGIEMLDPMKNRRIDSEGVVAKFGVKPERVIDVQALAGDAVDNVPGAPGIGVKTAALLINEFGDLENLLENAATIKQQKRRETLLENQKQILLSRDLVQLDDTVPLSFTLDDLELQSVKPKKLLSFLTKMEFKTLTQRVAEALKIAPSELPEVQESPAISTALSFDPGKYICITDMETLENWTSKAKNQGFVAVDTETTSLDEMKAELVGISLALAPGEACYIPLGHRSLDSGDLLGTGKLDEGQLPLNAVLECLAPLLNDPAVLKIGQNIKYDLKVFARYGVALTPIEDTMLMSYALNAGQHNHAMDALSLRYLDHSPISIKTLLGSGKSAITFDRVPIEDAVSYGSEDADITLRLWQFFRPQLHRAQVTRVYERLERPLIPVLADMERAGVKVDRDTLNQMSNRFAQKMSDLEAEIHTIAGETFNVGSPKQLGEILFEKMNMPNGKRGKTGAYTTSADVLEDLATEHELPRKVLDWRQLSKLKSTYTDALQSHINPETGRVHTSYSIAGANTGRLASTDPNLQNIPIRSEDGRRIRKAFIAEPGNVIVSLDYSQIELRILADMANIDSLKQAFRDGLDIHAMTAAQMFDVPIEGMDPLVRRQAKAINFGVIYGISGFGLARNLRIPRAKAQAFIDAYFARFPGIQTYMDETIKRAREKGFVETLFGRKIHTPEINAKGPAAGFARRAAINAPIQGTAADIIRRAMIRMPAAISDLPAKMLLQVHDELVFEVAEDACGALIGVAKSVMQNAATPAVHISVPLVVDAGIGENWAQAH